MANKKYVRLQCPLDLDILEHNKLYKHVLDETNGKNIAEFLRSLIRLHREGKLISSQITVNSFKQPVVEEDDSYMDNLVL